MARVADTRGEETSRRRRESRTEATKVTPASVTVKAGIIAGEVTEMKVTELVEQGSDRVVSPAKLTGTLRLKNTSANQTVHLVGGKIQYIDGQDSH